ncbi:hypothetical protein GC090_11020 [Pantoea sp. JZ29]|uniref:hypothetical protein n=1 Tax=Pantoea sp. JZ29 TaxID=2654192 RepID=UPI002B48D0A1|nr:hypothetical protein [Pantoea sp. JZ29]WRH21161.1 hypothetical protein GC090_11020 [Pantoea sp. JZ29]
MPFFILVADFFTPCRAINCAAGQQHILDVLIALAACALPPQGEEIPLGRVGNRTVGGRKKAVKPTAAFFLLAEHVIKTLCLLTDPQHGRD